MISQPKNRVQAIKSKFENLSSEPIKQPSQLFKLKNESEKYKENSISPIEFSNTGISDVLATESGTSSDETAPEPNRSYLYKSDVKRSVSEPKASLSRQSSDPGKKLHRSHAFRCDRTQKITSPKRSGSCSSRPDTIKMDRKLSKHRLKKLGDFLDEQMKKENFTLNRDVAEVKEVGFINSIPDEEVPQHILIQYAQVIKPKPNDDKNEAMTDSGVSSETENLEEDKGRVKKITNEFESKEEKIGNNKTELLESISKSNLDVMEELAGSSETMKLERKNPQIILTDTLKKALKQPLPAGPPPKKPPRTFTPRIPENEKKDTKRKLEKLEQVLMKRETVAKKDTNIYDIAEENLSLKRPKEVHYLCTEIFDIAQKTLLPNQNESSLKNCFNKLSCTANNNSMSSLPYTRLSSGFDSNRNSKNCCTCSNDSLNGPQLLVNDKCAKCQVNDDKHDRFKCHLDCKCRVQNSKFYDDEPIYDEPFVGDDKKTSDFSKYSDDAKRSDKNKYGVIKNVNGAYSKSLEDIRAEKKESAIYDIPTDPTSPKLTKTDFQKLLQNFENGASEKPIIKDRISPSKLSQKSIEELKLSPKLMRMSAVFEEGIPEVKFMKKEQRFATEVRRFKPERVGFSLPRKNPQLDVDRENLNALMNEIYETVTAACNMEENKPGSFPTDQPDSGSSEESVKLTRSLTEKRKNYVRRVSSRLAYLEPKSIKTTRFRHQTSVCSYRSDQTDNPYSTFRSWKSFRASQNNLTSKMDTDSKFNLTDSTGNILSLKNDFDISDQSIDTISIDEKTGCVDIELPFEPREHGLFNVCLLVGLNYMTAQAYVKSVFPSQVTVPQHIENLIFPETLGQDKGEWSADAKFTQCYSFVLTDERGERSYGYCRRVLPEGATACLPLCYCLIGKYRAPGFYYKVLQEIESHHGGSENAMNSVLQQLFESDFPNPGEELTLTIDTADSDSDKCDSDKFDSDRCKSDRCKTMPDMRKSEFFDPENNNSLRELMLCLNTIRIKTITRPLESRAEESSSCELLDSLGAGLLVKVFGSLLLERKLVVRADKLSALSSLLEGLQSSLYPFVWQQPLISCVPAEIQRAVLDAPLPILAGMLDTKDPDHDTLEEGMFIDFTHPSKVLCYQGDESTILPTNSYKTLKTSLQMESIKNKDRDDTKTRNVMISEAFLRFFVDIMGDYWRFFSFGVLRDGDMGKGDVVFDKESFIKSATSKQNQFFLEWFTETAMFNHFIQNMAIRFKQTEDSSKHDVDSNKTDADSNKPDLCLIDTPTPNFYQLFEERINSRRTRANVDRSGYKNALNKRVKLLKARLKDLVG